MSTLSIPQPPYGDLSDAAAQWAARGLRLAYFLDDGGFAESWRYADKAKKVLRTPDTPDEARAKVKRYGVRRLCVEPPANIAVIDIDDRPKQGWRADYIGQKFVEAFQLPRCPTAVTPSGGYHIWVALPPGCTTRNWTSQNSPLGFEGVDIRTFGGLATVPPSSRKDGVYTWGRWIETPPMASPALVKALTPPPPPANCAHGEAKPFNTANVTLYVERAYEDELSAVRHCQSGGRNHQLFKSAAALASICAAGALPAAHVKASLYQAAGENGSLKEDGPNAIRKTIESGFTAGLKEPRKLPNGSQTT